MKCVQSLGFLLWLNVLIALVVSSSTTIAHDEITTTYDWHKIVADDEDTDECHCHVPGEAPVEVSCDDVLTMELLLELERVDQSLYFGLRVEPENTCTEYNSAEYPYGSTIDVIKAKEMGGIFGAFENQCFDTFKDVDVDHLVARKEAHDSGLCAAEAQIKINFANDLENIALASASVNRSKSDRDPSDWLPDHNACWYVWQHMHIKRKYQMTIDEAEKKAIDSILQDCSIEELVLEIDESCTLPEY
ncbi:MAG: hypothetical protein F4W92_02065 [Gammaproteobacteria bacterium]|nr:hypothetical protein [Gammaproteobacteria bacterium]